MCTHGSRIIGLRESDEFRCGERYLAACARRGAQGLYREVKVHTFVRNYRAAHREVHIVEMERSIGEACKVLAGKHLLVTEVVLCNAVELVRARFGSEHGLQSSSAAIFAGERIDLNGGFLDCVGLRGEIQNALAYTAGDIETIDHVLVVILALAIGAGVNLLFGGVVIHTRCRTAGRAGSQAGGSWRHSHKRHQVAPYNRQLRDCPIIKR